MESRYALKNTFYISGDITEDPEHPKIVWPSDATCPLCRPHPWNPIVNQRNVMINVEGQIWNIAAVADYLISVYSNEHIIKNMQQRNVVRPGGVVVSHTSNNSPHHINQNKQLTSQGMCNCHVAKIPCTY